MFAVADPAGDPFAAPIEPEELDLAARVAVGLDAVARNFDLDGAHRRAGGARDAANRP